MLYYFVEKNLKTSTIWHN